MKNKLLIKIGDFIVNFRYLILSIFVVLITICICNINNVDINYNITSYLPDETETKNGLELMEKEFGTLNSMQLMLNDISYDEALEKKNVIAQLEHVKTVSFDNTENYYKDNNALIVMKLDQVTDEERNNVKEKIEQIVSDEEYYLYVENEENAVNGMTTILILVVTVIIIVLLLTSKSYFDIVLAFLVFGISILLNMGSNFLLGEISFITKSIAVVLQLGLSLDYLIIFLNHYMKEIKDTNDKYLAVKKTVSKSIPEIFASSLTTISGLMALVFMQLKIGGDIGIVMSKGIICSMLTVILLLPCFLLIFHKLILKLEHKNFIPDTTKLSKFIVSGRKVLLPIFLIITVISICLIKEYQYAYNINSVKSYTLSENNLALEKIENTFGSHNQLVILVQNKDKDYKNELEVVSKLLEEDNIISVISIGNVALSDNIYLGTDINYQQFASIFQIDSQMSKSLYQMYASNNNQLELLGDVENYKVTIIDWIYFLEEHKNELPLDDIMKTKIDTYHGAIEESISLLESDDYSRFILELKGNIEGEETFELLNTIKETVNDYYDNVTLVGESVSARDLHDTFNEDNIKITIITVLFIAIILLFTFKSLGITLLLILTIEGSILINFGLVTLMDQKIFFISYIIVSAIQMGATIDYAIVMSNRYMTLRKKMDKKEALVGTLKDSLPAIVTSGLILTIAGFLIGFISDSGVVASIGLFLGSGTLISMICTIFILPAILYACDKLI